MNISCKTVLEWNKNHTNLSIMDIIQDLAKSESPRRVRVVVMGANGVGKSALLNRLVRNIFCEAGVGDGGGDSVSMIRSSEEEIYRMEIYCGEDCALHLELQDTDGSYVSHGARRLAIATAHVFVLVYSVCDLISFQEVIRLCEEIITQRGIGNEDAPILLVGNKTDLGDNSENNKRVITLSEAIGRVATWGIRVVETSAKQASNMSEVIHEILRLCDASPDLFLQARRMGGWRYNISYVLSCCFKKLP